MCTNTLDHVSLTYEMFKTPISINHGKKNPQKVSKVDWNFTHFYHHRLNSNSDLFQGSIKGFGDR